MCFLGANRNFPILRYKFSALVENAAGLESCEGSSCGRGDRPDPTEPPARELRYCWMR